jgi:hypothetical protein
MGYEIGPLRDSEIDALAAFLVQGFGARSEAIFVAPDVLRWKYLHPRGTPNEVLPRSLVARDGAGKIVGHVGFVPSRFLVTSPPEQPRVHAAVHMIDWLAAPEYRGVGGALMRRVNRLAPIQYGFGGTGVGRTVIKGAGFEPWPSVPVFSCVLRSRFAFRVPGNEPKWRRLLKAFRDQWELGIRRSPHENELKCELFSKFDDALETLRLGFEGAFMTTAPEVSFLNALVAFPRRGISAWRLEASTANAGKRNLAAFALLSVIDSEKLRIGKIVELVLPNRDVDAWHAAYGSLREQLHHQEADIAFACGSTPWEAEALRRAGFRHVFDLELSIRDRAGLLPRDIPCHTSFLEADYSYLP